MPERPFLAQHSLPSVTVDRLVRCCRLCARLKAEGKEYTSSYEIGERLGCGPSQVRKDLSKLGRLGTRGSGYRVSELQEALGRVLGRGRSCNVVLVGAGNLGRALLRYGGFEQEGFRFVAVFDVDPGKVGTRLGGLSVRDVSDIPRALSSLDAEIGVLAVSAAGAQGVAELLAQNGVRAILNFAPTVLWLGGDVVVNNVDLAVELERLRCYLTVMKTEAPGSDLAAL